MHCGSPKLLESPKMYDVQGGPRINTSPPSRSYVGIPLTPMNPDYEYMLPPQLALRASLQLCVGSSTKLNSTDSAVGPQCIDAATPCPCGIGATNVALTTDGRPTATVLMSNTACIGTCISTRSGSEDNGHTQQLKVMADESFMHTEVNGQAEEVSQINSTCVVAPAWATWSHGDRSAATAVQPGLGVRCGPDAIRDSSIMIPGRPSGAGAANSQKQEQWLHWQLNQFTKEDIFLGRFEVLGQRERRRGGAARCA